MNNYTGDNETIWTYDDSKNLAKIPGLLVTGLLLLCIMIGLGVVGYMRIEERTDKISRTIVHELVVKPTHKVIGT